MSDQAPSAGSGANPSRSQATSITVPSSRWGISLLVAAAVSWVWLNYTPVQFNAPEELLTVDIYSPPALQQAAAETNVVLYWQNNFMKFGGVGFCFGAAVLMTALGASGRQRWGPVVLGLVSGVVCGVVAVVAGTYLRRYLNGNVTVPLVDAANRQLVTDTGVYMLTSMLLVLPVSLAVLVGSGNQRVQKAVAIVLAGAVTGLVTPLAVSHYFRNSQTNQFPPEGLVLTAIWMTVLAVLVFVLSTFTGTQTPRVKSSTQEGAA